MKIPAVLLASAALIFGFASCDKHSFESTKVLHEGMHKEGHGEGHGAEAHKEGAHAEAPAHGAAPAHGEAKKEEAKH